MFRKQNQGFSLTHILIVVLAIAGVVLIGFGIKHASAVAAERQRYKEADAQITSFVNDAAKLAPSIKEIKRYCSRTSEEYSKGSLGCVIRGEVTYTSLTVGENTTIQQLARVEHKLPWKIIETAPSVTASIKDAYYNISTLRCSIRHTVEKISEDINSDKNTKLQLVIDCSGSALSEYYPVAKS